MTSVAENLEALRQQIGDLEVRYGRPAGAVNLLAVSKMQSADKIREAAAAGARDFGENYLQEAEQKMAELADLDLVWHFIGPIQSNKTRGIAEAFQWVHSVDREKIARRLAEQRPPHLPDLNVCVQVNLSGEATKSGSTLEQARDLCDQVALMPRLRLRGLMAIPAPLTDFEDQRAAFAPLADCFRELQLRHDSFDTLSMGMSNDFEAAIAEGSTLVRLGTAIFGARG